MLLRVLRNSEVKKYLILLLIIQLLFCLLFLRQQRQNTQRLNEIIIEEKIATIGFVLRVSPELKEEAISFLYERASEENIIAGIDEARKYGIVRDLPFELNQTMINYHIVNNRNVIIYITLLSIFTLFLTLILLSNIYKKIGKFSDYAEAVVEGNFELINEEQEEGDFPKLIIQFNNMARRLKNAVDSLQQEKVYLKNVISDISHQLKTPLSSIKMFNELLMDGELQNIEISSNFLEKSQGQIERMEWLIINLLKMAKLETKSIEFDLTERNLTETINRALMPLIELARERNITIDFDINDKIIIKHDENWLGEAISNIVKNAIEQSPEKAKIDIGVIQTPLTTKIIVKDRAGGIAQEDILHVFDRFYKGKNSKNPNSTGIGLSLAKAIVENHNGSITVKNVDYGAMFTIVLYKDESI